MKPLRILTITLVLTAAMTARAGTNSDMATARDLPPRTPWKHPRIMTMLDETSTSDCIGRPVTPLCAVETKMACFLRNDDSLCEVASGENFNLSGMAKTPASYRYRVTKTAIVDDRHFPWLPIDKISEPSRVVPRVKVGDIRIEVLERMCFDFSAFRCEKIGVIMIYIVRKVNGFWSLQGWKSNLIP